MKKTVVLFILMLSSLAFSQQNGQGVQSKYVSIGGSLSLRSDINLITSYSFEKSILRLSIVYSNFENSPRGVELSFLRKIHVSSFTHSLVGSFGHGQFGYGVTGQQIYLGIGYHVQWNNFFGEYQLPIFIKNRGGYEGLGKHFKLGYVFNFR